MTYKLVLTIVSLVFVAMAPVRAAEDNTVLLNTLGYTTGQAILLTPMAVGTLADAVAGKAYKADQATTFVTTYINVTKGMKDQMKKLIDADTLTKNDSQFVQTQSTCSMSSLARRKTFRPLSRAARNPTR
jgi:hypothetical protein